VEVADPIAQRGRQNFKTRNGEHLEVLPGFLRPACCPKVPCEQGRAVGLKRELVGPAKPKWRERSEGQAAVRLADNTPRSGEPTTWGSGQRALTCSKATWSPCKGKIRSSIQRDELSTMATGLERIAAHAVNQRPEERRAGNPHATFCGRRRRVTASADPVDVETEPRPSQ
jgi:hypothetical protein